MEIFLREYGETLSVDRVKRQFVVYGKDRVERLRIPVHRVDYIRITSGNKLSSNVLFWASTYGIDVMMLSDTGRPMSFIVPIDYQKYPERRIAQYKTRRGLTISKRIIKKKIQNQLDFLEYYGYPCDNVKTCLERIEQAETLRHILTIEGQASVSYFKHYMISLCKGAGIRVKRNARDPLNNLLNLGYELLKAELLKGIYRYHLDPYFGFLHTPSKNKPALACDLMEPFRVFVDVFVIHFSKKKLRFEDHGGRNFLDRKMKLEFIKEFNRFLDQKISLDKKFKNNLEKITIRSLIKDESSRLSKYLGGEKKYTPLEHLGTINFQEIKQVIKNSRYSNADWTREEVEILKKLHSTKTYDEIGKDIDKTPKAVERKADKIRLKKKYRKWTMKDERFLKANLGKMSITELAKRMNKPKSGVHYRTQS